MAKWRRLWCHLHATINNKSPHKKETKATRKHYTQGYQFPKKPRGVTLGKCYSTWKRRAWLPSNWGNLGTGLSSCPKPITSACAAGKRAYHSLQPPLQPHHWGAAWPSPYLLRSLHPLKVSLQWMRCNYRNCKKVTMLNNQSSTG